MAFLADVARVVGVGARVLTSIILENNSIGRLSKLFTRLIDYGVLPIDRGSYR